MVSYGEIAGFTFDGIHNTEVGVTLSGDVQIGNPKKIKVKERVTGTNIEYDFSTINGIQEWEPRILYAPLNIMDFDVKDYRSTQLVATRVFNWLARPNERVKLTIDKFPDYYFMAEVVNLDDFETNVRETGEFTVEFESYPLKYRDRLAVDDEFRTFNFYTDVRQKPGVLLPPMEDQLPFKKLNVGDLVNIGGWAQYTGSGGKTSRYHTSQTYMIEEIRTVDDVDFSRQRYDSTQYYLAGLNDWVRSQDIVQARTGYEVEVHNAGIVPVVPTLRQDRTGISLAGLTVDKNGRLYNIERKQDNRHMTLDPGENKLLVYGQSVQVDFIWRDEVV